MILRLALNLKFLTEALDWDPKFGQVTSHDQRYPGPCGWRNWRRARFVTGVPAPWLAGSLIATIIAIYSNQKLELPDWLRTLAFILLGIQTGTAVNTDTLYRAAQWPLSIVCMGVTVVIIVWACMLYYERLRNWNRATAYFASLPGALSMVILLASTSGADMRRVTISQSVRLFFLIAALPVVILFISPPLMRSRQRRWLPVSMKLSSSSWPRLSRACCLNASGFRRASFWGRRSPAPRWASAMLFMGCARFHSDSRPMSFWA